MDEALRINVSSSPLVQRYWRTVAEHFVAEGAKCSSATSTMKQAGVFRKPSVIAANPDVSDSKAVAFFEEADRRLGGRDILDQQCWVGR